MKVRIVWRTPAFDQTQAIIRAHPDRTAEFAAGLRQMTRELLADPTGAGESRGAFYRVGVFGPLTVNFLPVPSQQTVHILTVHLPH